MYLTKRNARRGRPGSEISQGLPVLAPVPAEPTSGLVVPILRNTFLTFYRIREREAAVAEDGVPDWDPPMFHDAPEDDGATMEAHTDLERAMRRLPEEFRTVLLLAEVEGLPLEEVARVMVCPVGTVNRASSGQGTLRGYATTRRDERAFDESRRDEPPAGGSSLRRPAHLQ
jgi:RNA polymerase sigma-70 factor (ECF subfamily)